ncbi:MAG: SpoIID/LytB domain-containing protein [bacterium]
MRRAAVGVAAILFACTSALPAPEPEVVPYPVATPAPKKQPPSPTPPRTPATVPDSGPVYTLNTPNRPSTPSRRGAIDAGDQTIRVLLSMGGPAARIASPGGLMLSNRDGSFLARAARDEAWRIESAGRKVRAVRPDGTGTAWVDQPLLARPIGAALISVSGKPYRGEVAYYAGDSGLAVVNVVKIDDYLRGVVPLEIGTRADGDSAAVQAQAVTARSYAYIHLGPDGIRNYDLTDGVLDQVYGGVAVETSVASEAVESTRTLVLKYAGRVVNAPYHSTCGGSTAAASEIWRSNDEPYLQRVSDRIPGTDRFYCDLSSRFHWTRTIEGPALNAALVQYLATYTSVPGRTPGIARDVTIGGHTASGRNSTITVTTDRGNFALRGNDMRFVLRQPGGEILNSTYFSVETTPASNGTVARLTLRGMGNGHGVGMCQWGAIGRARAGQDYRTILRTYYPGTTIGAAF